MLVILCLPVFPSYPGVSHLWVQPTSMETVFLHSQPQMPSHDGIYTVFYGVGWIKGCKVLTVESKVTCGFSTVRKWRPLIPALFKSQQYFFPAVSHFQLVFTSLSAGMNRLTSTASAHTSLQYFLPDSLHGDSFCLTLVCSLSMANTSVSTSFIEISLLNHLREFCFLLGPWWTGWVYQVLHDLTSLLPSLPTLRCVFQPWQGWGCRSVGVLFPLPELCFLTLFIWLSSSLPSLKLPCIWNALWVSTKKFPTNSWH